MKNNIKYFLKKIPFLYYFYRVASKVKYKYTQTFPQTCKKLSKANKPLGLNEWKLLKASSTKPPIHSASEHGFYLSKVDTELKLAELKYPVFIGIGGGTWNLRIYRSGIMDGTKVFEKVYLSNSVALKKLLWFYGKVIPEIKDKFDIPKFVRC